MNTPKQIKRSGSERISGYVERITFRNEENGYTVAQLKTPKRAEPTCVVGTMPMVQPGESILCEGQWLQHPTFGLQFILTRYESQLPADATAITKYLGSGLIKGIGHGFAKRIVACFGKDTLSIIDQDPEKLRTVPGLGDKRREKIITTWAEQRTVRDVMLFLQKYGISPTFSQKIFRAYGQKAIDRLNEDPYRLAKDIHGIGFKSADEIARKMGIEVDNPKRIEAGIHFTCFELAQDGHTCYPLEEFIPIAAELLHVSAEAITHHVNELKNRSELICLPLGQFPAERPFVWLPHLHEAENSIARDLQRLSNAQDQLRSIDVDKALAWVQNLLQMQLAEGQYQAVAKALVEKVQIITGGPGTGKSTITKAILRIMEKLTDKIILAAPTGRAAKRMSEITGYKAQTIHSLLEYDFSQRGFKKNRQNPLTCDLIILDEASMIDTMLMSQLLRAIPSCARLILVGDIYQLPSVGPGNVLRDIIAARCVVTTSLQHIYRQAEGSQIIVNAHAINDGRMPALFNDPKSDFFFLRAEEPEEAVNLIVSLVHKRLPEKYGWNVLQHIQVLSPMKKGILGIDHLNQLLQHTLNAQGGNNVVKIFGRAFHLGDKVMQIRNDYKKNTFNGDIGTVSSIDHDEECMTVCFDEQEVLYPFSDLDDLVLAYAVSIHKYQGSEAPCVIIPIHTSHFIMLHRNLLYTGVTRGRKMVILVGTSKAIAMAVRNDEVKKRYTALRDAVQLRFKTHKTN